jgi:hypothetical protein
MKFKNKILEQTGPGITAFNPSSDEAKLGEKISDETKRQNELKAQFDENFITVKIPYPNKFNQKMLVLPKGTATSFFNKGDYRISFFRFKEWDKNPKWAPYVPKENDLREILPDNTLKSFKLVDGTSFKLTLKRESDTPLKWVFNWYYDENDEAYDQNYYIGEFEIPKSYIDEEDGFWDKWGWIIMAGLSVAATALFPGAPGLWLSLAIDLVPAIEAYRDGSGPGVAIAIILALIPFGIAKIPGLGTITKSQADNLANKFVNALDEADIKRIYGELSKTEKNIFQRVFRQDPTKMLKSLDDAMWNNIINGLQTGQYTNKEIVNIINKLIKDGTLKYPDLVKWYQKSGIKRFGVELGATGLVVGGLYLYNKNKTSEVSKLIKSDTKNMSREEYNKRAEEGFNFEY